MVEREANPNKVIHKGKFPVTEWLDKVFFPKDIDYIEGCDADELLRGVAHRTYQVCSSSYNHGLCLYS